MTRYAYNGAGDLLSLTDGKNQTTRFAYDQYGRMTNQVDATGTTIFRFNGRRINRNRRLDRKGGREDTPPRIQK